MLVFVLTHVDCKYEPDIVQPFFFQIPDWQSQSEHYYTRPDGIASKGYGVTPCRDHFSAGGGRVFPCSRIIKSVRSARNSIYIGPRINILSAA